MLSARVLHMLAVAAGLARATVTTIIKGYGNMQQRWVKLPSGAFIDAARICYVSKVESFPKLDEDGNNVGVEYAVTIGTDVMREAQLLVSGSADEIKAVMKSVLGG